VFGIARELIARWRPEREIDPIEANALHGGRMSLRGSIIVAAQTAWSSGVGASVGLEAGYTQFASGIASRIGMAFRLRRADLRILVGCGAAGGIAGAFGAPLAGAFYGFELIIGGYSPNSLAPVAISALIGYLVAHVLAPAEIGVVAPEKITIATHDLVMAAAIGLLSAVLGILLMRGVALCESLFVRLKLRPALRTTVGGLAVGLLAIVSPQVMSSGHGALHLSGMLDLSLRTVALFFVLKIAASIVSLGSGFRGGLFFFLAAYGRPRRPSPGGRAHHELAERLFRFESLRGDWHERARGFGHRRPPDHDLHRVGDDKRLLAHDGGAHRRDYLLAGDAGGVRLFIRHLAPSFARRDDS
jgi:chloride channel protein, CIC family